MQAPTGEHRQHCLIRQLYSERAEPCALGGRAWVLRLVYDRINLRVVLRGKTTAASGRCHFCDLNTSFSFSDPWQCSMHRHCNSRGGCMQKEFETLIVSTPISSQSAIAMHGKFW